MFQEVVATGAY
jgi:chromosome segregation ATPase